MKANDRSSTARVDKTVLYRTARRGACAEQTLYHPQSHRKVLAKLSHLDDMSIVGQRIRGFIEGSAIEIYKLRDAVKDKSSERVRQSCQRLISAGEEVGASAMLRAAYQMLLSAPLERWHELKSIVDVIEEEFANLKGDLKEAI